MRLPKTGMNRSEPEIAIQFPMMTYRKLQFIAGRVFVVALLMVSALAVFTSQAMAQSPDKECEALMKQVNDLVDKVAEVSQRIERVQERVEKGVGTASSLDTDKDTL